MNVLAEYITKTIRFSGDLEGEEVVIKKLSANDQKELGQITDETEKGIAVILKSVVRWSFKNHAEQPIAVNRDNLGRIRGDIINALGIEVMQYNKPAEVKDASGK